MCGIGGIFYPGSGHVEKDRLIRMGESIAHRGPDQEGMWIDESQRIGLVHKRLSIIDLSENGRQPMHYNNRYVIVYNGEIYNYPEIREELMKEGVVVKTATDTEVILAAFHLYRENCLKLFNGMFAFAIWDNQDNSLFCARDRFGEKPFYYFFDRNCFCFGSEMKSLWAAGVPKEISYQMLYLYLKWDLIENPENAEDTFYRNIFKLPPSHYMYINGNGKSLVKYWDVTKNNQSSVFTIEEAVENYRFLFRDAVKIRLRSDVPVGSSLSGGVDSSSIVAIVNGLKDKNQKQHTFSARFKEKEFDEGYYIDILTSSCDLNTSFTYPDEHSFTNQIEKIFYHQEEPFGSASIVAQWEVMKLARNNNVTVLLDGQGADEILGGYTKYLEVFLRERYLRSSKDYKKEKALLSEVVGLNHRAGMLFKAECFLPSLVRLAGKAKRSILPDESSKVFTADFLKTIVKQCPPFRSHNSLNGILYYDTLVYGLKNLLRFCDRNAMAFGVEVRLPFLDYRLVDFLFSLPSQFKINNGYTKYIHRLAMEKAIPNEICWRKDKLSYQAPQSKWLANQRSLELYNTARETLISERIIKTDLLSDPWQIIMAGMLIK